MSCTKQPRTPNINIAKPVRVNIGNKICSPGIFVKRFLHRVPVRCSERRRRKYFRPNPERRPRVNGQCRNSSNRLTPIWPVVFVYLSPTTVTSITRTGLFALVIIGCARGKNRLEGRSVLGHRAQQVVGDSIPVSPSNAHYNAEYVLCLLFFIQSPP